MRVANPVGYRNFVLATVTIAAVSYGAYYYFNPTIPISCSELKSSLENLEKIVKHYLSTSTPAHIVREIAGRNCTVIFNYPDGFNLINYDARNFWGNGFSAQMSSTSSEILDNYAMFRGLLLSHHKC